MKNTIPLATFFFAAVLTLQAYSAPPMAKSCHESLKDMGSECEYPSLNTGTLMEDIKTACRRIIRNSSTVHQKLLGPNSPVSS